MKRLEDISIGNRVVITVAIVLAILFILAAIGYFSGGWEAQGETASEPSPYDEQMDSLQKQALNEAFKTQMVHLFKTWVADFDPNHSNRPIKGAANARKAYIAVMAEIEKRERKR